MMTGEQPGVEHEPRHDTACVSWWIKTLENDRRGIRAAAVDVQRMFAWLFARERDRPLWRLARTAAGLTAASQYPHNHGAKPEPSPPGRPVLRSGMRPGRR